MNALSVLNYPESLRNDLSRHMNNSLSTNTRKNYKLDVNHFLKWGGTIPATPEMIAGYLVSFGDVLNPRTLSRRLKAIRKEHMNKMHEDPTKHPLIINLMTGINKGKGVPVKKAKPLLMKDATIIHNVLRRHNSLQDCRNLAIILVGLGLAMRCSEITEIKYEHLNFVDNGVEVFIPRSKTDQTKQGKTRLLAKGKDICAVECLKAWIERAKIKDGYVFKNVLSNDAVGKNPLHRTSIHTIIKDVTEQCLDDFKGYSGHSLRRGFATNGLLMGISAPILAKFGRWESIESMMRYFEDEGTNVENPTAVLFGGGSLNGS